MINHNTSLDLKHLSIPHSTNGFTHYHRTSKTQNFTEKLESMRKQIQIKLDRQNTKRIHQKQIPKQPSLQHKKYILDNWIHNNSMYLNTTQFTNSNKQSLVTSNKPWISKIVRRNKYSRCFNNTNYGFHKHKSINDKNHNSINSKSITKVDSINRNKTYIKHQEKIKQNWKELFLKSTNQFFNNKHNTKVKSKKNSTSYATHKVIINKTDNNQEQQLNHISPW